MKTRRWLCIAVIGLTVVSCGKVRELAGKAKRVAETGVSGALGSAKVAESKPDPKLQALVDQTAEGALFRKDLPFPEHLQTKVERSLTFDNARLVIKSAIGNQVIAFSGTRFFTTVFDRAGDRVKLTMESAGFSQPEVTEGDKAKGDKAKAPQAKGTPAKGAAPKAGQAPAALPPVPDELTAVKDLTGCQAGFVRSGKSWKAEHSTDFKLVVWSGNLAPHLTANCIDAGVLPRAYWFGTRRLKPGDSVPLSGAELGVLLGEGATGSLVLKLESFEASGGHPCGVFSVTGSYHAAAVPGLDGQVSDQEVSITSGKVWLSLIHPVVIREELETVQTISTGMRSGHSTYIQGKVAVVVTREWKPAEAASK